jgi:hypothetical protein
MSAAVGSYAIERNSASRQVVYLLGTGDDDPNRR